MSDEKVKVEAETKEAENRVAPINVTVQVANTQTVNNKNSLKAIFEKKEKKKEEKKKKSWQRELLEWALTFVAALVIAFVVRSFIFQPVYVDGNSMYPTLRDGEIMYVSKTSYGSSFFGIPFTDIGFDFTVGGDPERFDVVVCHYDDGDYNVVKRVVGIPGDTVELREGVLYINGKAYEEDFIYYRGSETFGPVTVPEGEYFLMGDNRPGSKDSRTVGTVTRKEIVGKVEAVLWHTIPNTLDDRYGWKYTVR